MLALVYLPEVGVTTLLMYLMPNHTANCNTATAMIVDLTLPISDDANMKTIVRRFVS